MVLTVSSIVSTNVVKIAVEMMTKHCVMQEGSNKELSDYQCFKKASNPMNGREIKINIPCHLKGISQ